MKKGTVFFIFFVLIIANFFSWRAFFFFREKDLKVVFFDVGQGDSIFIRTPEKHYILIDGGKGDSVISFLGEEVPFFDKSLDLVILTHTHNDHLDGLFYVFEQYEVKNILFPGVSGETQAGKKWEKIIEEEGYKKALAGTRASGKDFYIDILYPEKEPAKKEVSDLNTISVVSRLVFKEDFSFLFMGDVYKKQEREIISYKNSCEEEKREDAFCRNLVFRSNVLKVGHHGGETSTSKEFLSLVSPEVAVISVGEENEYGHPHKEVLEKLEDLQIEVKRTDRDGSIVFRVD